MTLTEFNSQNINQRAETLWSWGFLMVKKSMATRTSVLFAVNGFFAELVISKFDNRVITIKGFNVEDVPLDYFRMINHDSPFVAAARSNADLLQELVIAA
jgi:hypothetical protein